MQRIQNFKNIYKQIKAEYKFITIQNTLLYTRTYFSLNIFIYINICACMRMYAYIYIYTYLYKYIYI